MTTPQILGKEQVRQIMANLPDDSSFEEILQELAFARMIDRGLEDSDNGRYVSHEEAGRRIDSWDD